MSVTQIDDQDPSIQYQGKWTKGGMDKEFKSTVTYSNQAGDSFVVPFTGTSIKVFATIDGLSEGVVTSYSIDGGTAVQATAGSVSEDTYSQQLWASPDLSPGKHKLQVAMVKVNNVPHQPTEGTVWFDRFDVSNSGDATTPTSTSTSTSTSGQSSTSPKTSATGKNNPTNTTSSSPSATQTAQTDGTAGGGEKSSTNTGAIVAGVIVALLFILALAAGYLWWRKRKARQINGTSDSFEKFFNNAPHAGETAQTRQPVAPSSNYPFAGAGAATASLNGAHGPSPGTAPGQPGSNAILAPGYNLPFAGAAAAAAYATPSSAHGPAPGQPGSNAVMAPGYNPNGHVVSTPPPPPSSFNPYGQHSSRPSLDSSSVTSSGVLPPSQQYFYAHNNENVLSYSAPAFPIATTKAPLPSGPPASAAPVPDPDSVAELKKRQQEAVANYNAGLAEGAGPQYIQHVDSGIRRGALELPPVYSAS